VALNAQELIRLKAQRFAFLSAVFDACEGGTTMYVHQREIVEQLGYDEDLAERLCQYLVDEGLLAYWSFGPTLVLTHRGVQEVERALADPEESTGRFPAVVMIENYIGSVHDSVVQQGTWGSTQIVAAPTLDVDAIRQLLAELGDALPAIRVEAGSELEALDDELGSAEPRLDVVRESLSSLRRIAEGAVGGGLATAAPQLPALVERLAHLIAALG
jgi:hypothetical protein